MIVVTQQWYGVGIPMKGQQTNKKIGYTNKSESLREKVLGVIKEVL